MPNWPKWIKWTGIISNYRRNTLSGTTEKMTTFFVCLHCELLAMLSLLRLAL